MGNSTSSTVSVPCLKDNYSYLHTFADNAFCLIVDAPELEPIVQEINGRSLEPLALLITHEHWDHINAAEEVKKYFPNIKVYAHPRLLTELSYVDESLVDEQEVQKEFYTFKALHTPAHSETDICFYFNENEPVLYTGDTIFIGGAGKLFWGEGKDLFQATEKIGALPQNTRIFCGHEYTKSNLEFALTLEPKNSSIKKALQSVNENQDNIAHIPSTLSKELGFNPYFRWQEIEILKKIQKEFPKAKNPEDILGSIRKLKDNWS